MKKLKYFFRKRNMLLIPNKPNRANSKANKSNKMMNYNGFNIEIYTNSAILHKKNLVEQFGYSRYLSLEEMIAIAIENRCPVIVRGGTNAKWYLKGKDKTENYVREKISKVDSSKCKRRTLYFIPQLCEQEDDEDTIRLQQQLQERISALKRTTYVQRIQKEWQIKIDEKKAEIAAKQLELFEMQENAFIVEETIRDLTDEEFIRRYCDEN